MDYETYTSIINSSPYAELIFDADGGETVTINEPEE